MKKPFHDATRCTIVKFGKIIHVTYTAHSPFRPGEEKFMVSLKYSGGNRYGNFLRYTFDKVREMTMHARVVRSLSFLLLQLFGNSRVRSPSPRRYEDRIACEISFPRWDARKSNAIKTAPHDQGRTRYIFPPRSAGVLSTDEKLFTLC